MQNFIGRLNAQNPCTTSDPTAIFTIFYPQPNLMFLINFINWDVSPEIFTLGFITLRWYGLLFVMGFVVGYYIMQRIFIKEQKNIEQLDRLSIYMGIATIVGARLGHCLFYEPDYYLANPLSILKIYEGGLASHGALVGIVLALYLYVQSVKKQGITYIWVLDRIAIPTALAGCFIRLGNLFNSEIVGDVTTLPWAFVFERLGDNTPRHPTQIYESVSYLLIFIVLYSGYWQRGWGTYKGKLLGWFFILIFGIRAIIELVKENQVKFEDALPINMGQILSIPVVLIGVFLVVRSHRQQPLTSNVNQTLN